MIRRPPRSTLSSSSAASDVYKRQDETWTVIGTESQLVELRAGGRDDDVRAGIESGSDVGGQRHAVQGMGHGYSFVEKRGASAHVTRRWTGIRSEARATEPLPGDYDPMVHATWDQRAGTSSR